MRNISVKLFEFGPVVHEMLFKDISYLELWWPLCSSECNHSCNINRGYHEEQFCKIILNLDLWFRRRYYFSKALVAHLFSRVEPFVQFW